MRCDVNLKIYNSDMNLQRVSEVFQNISSSQVINTQEDWYLVSFACLTFKGHLDQIPQSL